MVTARRHPVVPRIGLAARFPLAGNPPATGLDRPRRIDEVEDHHDVADIALGSGREIGIAAVEIVAVHAAPRGDPLREELRLARPRHVVDRDAAAELGRPRLPEPLVVDHHDAVSDPHLVGMPTLRQVDARQ
jgi:hypothetical protein